MDSRQFPEGELPIPLGRPRRQINAPIRFEFSPNHKVDDDSSYDDEDLDSEEDGIDESDGGPDKASEDDDFVPGASDIEDQADIEIPDHLIVADYDSQESISEEEDGEEESDEEEEFHNHRRPGKTPSVQVLTAGDIQRNLALFGRPPPLELPNQLQGNKRTFDSL